MAEMLAREGLDRGLAAYLGTSSPMPLFTGGRGRGVLRASPVRSSWKFDMCGKQEVSASVKVPLVGINSTKEVKSIAVYCFTQPIQPGKRDDARAIFEEIRTSRRDEYESSRKRLGIREERV
jgi:hypothetical protein